MIYQLTEKEESALKAHYEAYAKLIRETEDEIKKLQPKKKPPKDPKDFETWLASGSQEWRDAREKKLKLIRQQSETIKDLLKTIYDRNFEKVAKDPEKIVASAYEEIDAYILRAYQTYEAMRTTGKTADGEVITSFSAEDIRATKDGFFLDAKETVNALLSVVSRHLEALKDDEEKLQLINDYIVKAVAESPYTSSDMGELFGSVEVTPQETTEKSILAIRPTNYVTTIDRITKQTFSNELIKPVDAEPGALWDVRLDSKGKVSARVAIDYNDLLSKGNLLELPKLGAKEYNVHDAIITLLIAGNRVMSYDMIFRAMTGKISGKVTVTDEARKTIDEALEKFRGTFRLEYEYKDADGNQIIRSYDEPLVSFSRIKDREKINGKIISGGIRLLNDNADNAPPLLKWARENHNEIDTRDITLLDVPKLNNGDESFTIKMCLYRRLISMRNEFERVKKSKYELDEKKRIIRYDYVYNELGLDKPNKDKCYLVKDKIDRCMKYWQDKKLFDHYEHLRQSSGYYAVKVWFLPKVES